MQHMNIRLLQLLNTQPSPDSAAWEEHQLCHRCWTCWVEIQHGRMTAIFSSLLAIKFPGIPGMSLTFPAVCDSSESASPGKASVAHSVTFTLNMSSSSRLVPFCYTVAWAGGRRMPQKTLKSGPDLYSPNPPPDTVTANHCG